MPKTFNTGLSDSPVNQRPAVTPAAGASGVDRNIKLTWEIVVPAVPQNGTTAKIDTTLGVVDIPNPDSLAVTIVDNDGAGTDIGTVAQEGVTIDRIQGSADNVTYETLSFDLTSSKITKLASGLIPTYIKVRYVIDPYGNTANQLAASETYKVTIASTQTEKVMTFVNFIGIDEAS